MDFMFRYALGNGENFVTITTSGGETMASLTVDAPDGFTDLQQPRISGAGSATPEPANLALLGLGGLALLGYGWRRQRFCNKKQKAEKEAVRFARENWPMAGGPEASCATRTTCPSPSWVMTASRSPT